MARTSGGEKGQRVRVPGAAAGAPGYDGVGSGRQKSEGGGFQGLGSPRGWPCFQTTSRV